MNGEDTKPVLLVFIISASAALLIFHLPWPTFNFHATVDHKQHSAQVTADALITSVWCRGDSMSDRICHFRDLCYHPGIDEFIFFYDSNKSVIHGVPNVGVGGGGDNFNFATLTSVQHLNTHHFRLTFLPAGVSTNLPLNFMEKSKNDLKTAIFLRMFKPDNLMHVLHDDLIPLFATLQELCKGLDLQCFKSYQLILLNRGGVNFSESTSPYHYLYSLLTGLKPIRDSDLDPGKLHCFHSAVVGISKETVWYQYGFHEPQGPITINRNNTLVTVRNFIEHISTQLKVNRSPVGINTVEPYAVFLSRSKNRLILNEKQLEASIYLETSWKVIKVQEVDSENLAEVVQLVSGAEMVVGMHGAALILSMFLQSGRILLELFPFAIPADRYTPYRTMASLVGIDLTYAAWENKIKENSVAHPNRPQKMGGINHLPKEERQRIFKSNRVHEHRCCDDPEWLYRIYQDTIVDITSFEEVLRKLFLSCNTVNKLKHSPTVFRLHVGAVRNLKCVLDTGANDGAENEQRFLLSWEEPWNAQFLPQGRLQFEIWLQLKDTDKVSAVLTSSARYALPCQSGVVYNCWVRGLLDDKPGPLAWVVCSPD